MKDGGSPPPAPDPAVSGQAQSASNIATAIANARLNRVNQTTPWGSISYTQGPVDANGVPTYSSEIKLDPQQQAQLDEQRRQQTQRQQIAAALLGQAGGALSKPLDLSGAHQVYDRYASQQPPRPQAQASPQASPRDALLEQLMQYLQSSGGGAVNNPSGNPNARMSNLLAGGAGAGAAGPSAPSTPTPPAATPAATPQGPSGPVHTAGNGALSYQGMPAGGFTIGDPGSTWKDIFPQGDAFGTEGPGKPIYDNTASEQPDASRAVSGYSGMNQQVSIDGQPFYRVGNLPRTADYFKSTDPSKFKYDPKYGVVTTPDNLTGGSHESFYDKYAPWLMMALAGGGIAAEAGGAFGGAEAAAPAATGTGVAPAAGAAIDTAPVAATAPMAEMGGATAAGGAPVTDLSVSAAQPSWGSQAMTNLQNGRGLFGLSGGQRAAAGVIPALVQLLRNGQQQRGK